MTGHLNFSTITEGVSRLFIILKPRINNQITAPEVRVIGENKENLGVMKLGDALALAHPESGLDLIEVVSGTVPPVVRLMSFDKYRYEREKAEKKERLAQKTHGIKQIQVSARSAENDLRIRASQLDKFLVAGHPVEIQLKLRGREKGNKTWAEGRFRDFLALITTDYKIIASPKFGGRGMIAQIAKK